MSAPDSNSTIDPMLLDLLVDGELPDPERRRLFEQLECVPGGWRSCALAFLEAQCWKQGFRVAAREQAPLASPPQVALRQSWLRKNAVASLAVAASFLIALTIGPALRGISGMRSPSGRTGGVAKSDADLGPATGSGIVRPTLVSEKPRRESFSSPAAVPPAQRMVTVALPDGSGYGQEVVRLPVTEEQRLDGSWLSPSPQTLPSEVQKELQRRGYQVRQYRDLLPVPMQDGRRLFVPVDEVEVHYVGNDGFQ